jgi:hypothetical protein
MFTVRRLVTDPDLAPPRSTLLLGARALFALSLVASLACSTNDPGGGTGGSGGGSGASVGGAGASGSGGGAGAPQGAAGGRGGTGGVGSGNTPGAGAGGAAGVGMAMGGGGAGLAGTSAGGVATGGLGGAGAGAGTGGAVSVPDTVTRTASTYAFRHFPIETNGEGVWSGPTSPAEPAITTMYDTVILENGYLRVTILPSYGGRVLSIVHKPTNRELLYQNPLGAPYLMQEGIFYYDYLVIMGGIFPSFPEPEHGKYWNQPYDFEVVSESAEAITVRMSRQDDRDLATLVPAKYDVGRTDVLVQLEVTLRAGRSALELATKLTNTRATPIPSFEYWTVTTLAPGSPPGQTAIPLETRILAKMDQVHCLESSWAWFGDAEERVSGEVFKWNNLAHFENWVDQGTAFANPNYRANWSGLANDKNGTNILRVSDNVETPGLKLWTFGKGSLSIDMNDPDVWLRPTIEMWHGVTPEFWARGTLAANEVKTWSDRYFATLGLPEITAATEYGALYLSGTASGADTVLTAAATLVIPNQTVKARLRLDGVVVAEQDVVVAAADATKVTATVPSSQVMPGAIFTAEFAQGDTILLGGQTTLK